MRDALVMMVEEVAEIGDESSSPSVTTSTNLVLTATVSVLLAICDKFGCRVEKAAVCLGRVMVSVRSQWLFLSGYIRVRFLVLDFFVPYHPIGRDPFVMSELVSIFVQLAHVSVFGES